MRKDEFLEKLEWLLSDISEEERAEALAFYRSYFEDAGEGNEAKIIAELESPEKIAEIIRQELGADGAAADGGQTGESSRYGQTGREETDREQAEREETDRKQAEREQTAREQAEREEAERRRTEREWAERGRMDEEWADRGQAGAYGTYTDSPKAKQESGNRNTLILVLVIIIGILTSPVWLGILTGIFGTVFGLSVALIAVTFAIFVVGAVFVGLGVTMLPGVSIPVGMVFIGVGLIILAVALLFLVADVWIYGRFFPWACKSIYGLCKKILTKNKEAQTV